MRPATAFGPRPHQAVMGAVTEVRMLRGQRVTSSSPASGELAFVAVAQP